MDSIETVTIIYYLIDNMTWIALELVELCFITMLCVYFIENSYNLFVIWILQCKEGGKCNIII